MEICDDFLLYDEALALKNLGFNELCIALRDEDEEFYPLKFSDYYDLSDDQLIGKWNGVPCVPTPLYQQAFRFFRDKYHLNGYCYQPNETKYWAHSFENKAKYDTYEEAELACLRKLIEITK